MFPEGKKGGRDSKSFGGPELEDLRVNVFH